MSVPHIDPEQLRGIPLFRGFSDEALAVLIASSAVAEYSRNETIIREQEHGTSLFVILEGQVKVSLLRPDGKEAILALLGTGEYFGDLSLLDNEPRSASVIAVKQTRVLIQTRKEFTRLLSEQPEIIDLLLVTIAGRIRTADQKIADLAFLDAIGRVVNVLCEFADKSGEQTDNGILIRDRFSHDQLSRMVATTRETVTHCMTTLERRGYILSINRDLLIYDIDELRDAF